jgi:hypothetical protein
MIGYCSSAVAYVEKGTSVGISSDLLLLFLVLWSGALVVVIIG